MFVGLQPQIYQVIHLEVSLHSMLVCILFLLILSNLQVFFQNLQNFLTFFNPILSFWSSTITKDVVNKSGCIITINLFKRRHANGHRKSRIVTKLTQMKPFYPCFLIPTNIVPQVSFQPLIYPLCLAISLWMIACARSQVCSHHFEEFLPKCIQKLVIYITILLGIPCNCNDPIWNFHTKAQFGAKLDWLVLTLGVSNGTKGSQIR